MIKLSRRLIFTFISIIMITGLFSEEEGKYAQGTIFFRVYSDFAYIQVNQNNIVETDQAWFNAIANEYGIYEMIHLFEYATKSELQHYYSCMFPDSLDLDVVKNTFKSKASYVENAYKDIAIEFHAIPEEEYYDYQWPLEIVQAEDAWDIDVAPTEEIIVAVVDTGINLYEDLYDDEGIPLFIPGIHPDLTNNILKDEYNNPIGYNVFSPNGYPLEAFDDIGPGTHVAGVVAATTNNNLGVASLAGWHENIKIMPVKIQKRYDGNYLITVIGSRALFGILWAAGWNQYGITADIINMSWGPPYVLDLNDPNDFWYYHAMEIAIQTARDNGCICVASAGNYGFDWADLPMAPASLEGVICVTASNIEDSKATYSSYAYWASLTAPGGDGIFSVENAHSPEGFISTIPTHDDYAWYYENLDPDQSYYEYQLGHWEPNGIPEPDYDFGQGTSISAPMVSSMLALMKAKFPALTNEQIIEKLYAACDNLQGCTPYNTGKLGAGRMNAYKSLSDGPFENFTIHDMTFEYVYKYIPANSSNTNVEISLKNWSHSDILITSIQGLLTCDPIYGITINQNNVHWNSIPQYEFDSNLGQITITDETGLMRQVVFELELTIETTNHGTLYETIPIVVDVRHNIKFPEIFSELTIDDLDNDGIDEIAFGSAQTSYPNRGKVYLYKNGTLYSSLTETPVTAKIAFADLNNDGFKEIIAVDEQSLYIYNHNFEEVLEDITSNPFNISVAVEDITDDGQLEIIINHSQGLVVYYNCGNLPTLYRFSFAVEGNICSEIALANVDSDPKKDVIFLVHDIQDSDILKLKKFNFELLSGNATGTIFSTDIGDAPNPENFHSYDATNILLLRRENDPELFKYHSIFFGRAVNETGGGIGDPTLDSYDTFGYDWHSETNPATEIWKVHEQGINNTQNNTVAAGKIIAGDFLNDGAYTSGLELITYADELIINIEGEGDTQEMENYIHGHVVEYIGMGGEILYPRNKHSAITNTPDHDDGKIYTFKNNKIKVYDADKNYLPEYTVTAGSSSNEISSIALGSASNMYIKEVYYLTDNGMLGCASISTDLDLLYECSQLQKNSRNTSSYYQPLPKTVYTLSIKHDVIIDKEICVGEVLTIQPSSEIRLEPGGGFSVKGSFNSLGTIENPIYISGLCWKRTLSYWNGINFLKDSESEIVYSVLKNSQNCLSYSDCFTNHILNDNIIELNEIGINFYNSSFSIYRNSVINNNDGIQCHQKASPQIGIPSAGIPGLNQILDNGTGIYSNESIPSLDNGHNYLVNNSNYNIEVYFQHEQQIKAELNWWGSNDPVAIAQTINNSEFVDYVPFDEEPFERSLSRDDSLSVFQQAYLAILNENYYEAIGLFEQIIADSIETIEDPMSVAGLYTCYLSINDINEFKIYIENQLALNTSVYMRKIFINYLALTYRSLEMFDDAIFLYEDILLNNPTYQDSCYAVIDIGNTYLEANGRASGRISQLRPESIEVHKNTTRILLESIRTGNHINNSVPIIEKSVLYQNYPNPFNPETTISFSIPASGKVNLSIYNIKGQKVKTLIQDELVEGFHEIVWNSKDSSGKHVASGVYFFKLNFASKDRSIKKMLLLK